jgi:hypothetical protein
VFGSISATTNEVLVPVSSEGAILRYGFNGEFKGSVGHFGSKPGTLNFPVAVEVSPEGVFAVLDKGRFCVVCYGATGQVLGEFGGKGHSPGWFVSPSLLAIPDAGRVVIGQIFQNKIQVCAMPDFVRGRNRQGANHTAPSSRETVSQKTSHTSGSITPNSSGSDDPQHHVPVSHLEVSE